MKIDYIKIGNKIEKKYHLEKYIKFLLDYWEESPTYLGHGFGHAIKVAVNAFNGGEILQYKNSDELFIGGLFHDIYRPAEGKDGEEDQRQGAKIVKEIFQTNKIPSEITEKVVGAILSHDSWRKEDNPPLFDLIISLADKMSHKNIFYYYVWASNKYSKRNFNKLAYKNYFELIFAFVKYQVRAWEIFKKYPNSLTDEAILIYIDGFNLLSKYYLADTEGKGFLNKIEEYAQMCRDDEIKYLKAFGRSEQSIKLIMKNFY